MSTNLRMSPTVWWWLNLATRRVPSASLSCIDVVGCVSSTWKDDEDEDGVVAGGLAVDVVVVLVDGVLNK